MGRLATYGAIGGLGKGLEQQYLLDREKEVGAEKTAREYQLQRLRNKGTMDRQRQSDTAMSSRATETERVNKATASVLADVNKKSATQKQAHELSVEKLRQTEQTKRDSLRKLENNPDIEVKYTKASQYFDQEKNAYVNTPEGAFITDRLITGKTYRQAGSIYVPVGGKDDKGKALPDPTSETIEIANSARTGKTMSAVQHLVGATSLKEARKRQRHFEDEYGFLPDQFFSTYVDMFGRNKNITEKNSVTETSPANPPLPNAQMNAQNDLNAPNTPAAAPPLTPPGQISNAQTNAPNAQGQIPANPIWAKGTLNKLGTFNSANQ